MKWPLATAIDEQLSERGPVDDEPMTQMYRFFCKAVLAVAFSPMAD